MYAEIAKKVSTVGWVITDPEKQTTVQCYETTNEQCRMAPRQGKIKRTDDLVPDEILPRLKGAWNSKLVDSLSGDERI